MEQGHLNNHFLANAAERFPFLRATFNRYSVMLPRERIVQARLDAKLTPRQIWTELGINLADCETLADHVAGMTNLLHQFSVNRFDRHEIRRQIAVWAAPRILAGELPLEEMGYKDRQTLRDYAADIVYECAPALAGRSKVLNAPYDENGQSYDDEACFVSDLDYIRTALVAQQYQKSYPALATRLNDIISNSESALLTEEGRGLWVCAFVSSSANIHLACLTAANEDLIMGPPYKIG